MPSTSAPLPSPILSAIPDQLTSRLLLWNHPTPQRPSVLHCDPACLGASLTYHLTREQIVVVGELTWESRPELLIAREGRRVWAGRKVGVGAEAVEEELKAGGVEVQPMPKVIAPRLDAPRCYLACCRDASVAWLAAVQRCNPCVCVWCVR